MPYIVDVPALLSVLAEKGKGDETSVHWAARILVENADRRALAIVERCMAIKSQTPRIAPVKLRQLWQEFTHPTPRAIIEACHDLPGDQPDTAMEDRQHAQQAAARRSRAPRNDHRRMDPTARRTHQERATIQRANETPGVIAAYDADNAAAGRPTPLAQLMLMGTSKTTAPGYDRDHDEDAVYPMFGFPCVYCWIQRTPSDHDGRKWDDGLCGECRSLDRPGIARELVKTDVRMEAVRAFRSLGITPKIGRRGSRTAAIAARCIHIISHTGNAALKILKNEWKRAHRDEDRRMIAEWGSAHQAATEKIPTYGFPCVYCWIQRTPSDHDGRTWDDGLCGECRSLDRPGIAPELAQSDARMEAICAFRSVGLMPEIGRHGSRAAAIAARCIHIISRTGNAAIRILQNEWKRAHRDEDRAVIAQWGTARKAATVTIESHGHPIAINTPISAPRCTECGEPAASRGLCGTCRALNIETPAAPITTAA